MKALHATAQRETFYLAEPGLPTLCLYRQLAPSVPTESDVFYVHGATFGAELSIFHRLDGRSWADDMNAAGFTVWSIDFAGYGKSDRYPTASAAPTGRIEDAMPQLQRAITAVRARNGGHRPALVAHSWGGALAARYASQHPQNLRVLALFAPIVTRETAFYPFAAQSAAQSTSAAPPAHYPLNLWAQYRRFVEDVPRRHSQVFDEAHFHEWGQAFLASDPDAATRHPPAVLTPAGSLADVQALWSGKTLYDPALISAPTLLVRGEWDATCSDVDVQQLLRALGSVDKACVSIERATHLMHLESQRPLLYNVVNAFLQRTMA